MGKPKGGTEVTTGYRYYFSILAGICRGPIDSIFIVEADGKIFYDNEITHSTAVIVNAPQLFGGDKGQGGLVGTMDLYFGAADQIITLADKIRNIMAGLRVSQMRGVVTSFYDGEICANDPYPKAWKYRVRRALKGWHGDTWYPEKAVIRLSDPAINTYTRGGNDTLANNVTEVTTLLDANGNPTTDPTAASSSVTSTYTGQTVTTYVSGSGNSLTYNVPAAYNDIYAMNPAHIIYECVTNPDWGRGLPVELIDHLSFASAANKLYSEGFGLCIKWSQQEDIDAFVQTVIDHIGAAVYTNPVTGLLCLRLLRDDYSQDDLSVFDYEHGLLEVTSVSTASTDALANEIIVTYTSPVLNMDREVRAQNIASINSLGSFFSVSKSYAGIPTSTLALKAAARELKMNGGGWKRIEFKVDRRGYAIVPGDVVRVTAPERGLNNLAVRIATVDHSEIKDGSITIVGTQDMYSWPEHVVSAAQPSTFQDVNRYPVPVTIQNISNATYRDVVKFAGATNATEQADGEPLPINGEFGIGQSHITIMAKKPTSVSIAYAAYVKRSTVTTAFYDEDQVHDWEITNYLNFQRLSTLVAPIGVSDTVFQISGEINPANARIGGCYMLGDASFAFYSAGQEEFVRLDAISQNPTTGAITVTVARGCVDTPAIPHAKGSRLWAYDESGGAVAESFGYFDNVFVKCLTHTISMGDLQPSQAAQMAIIPNGREYRVYCGAGFKVGGFFRDQIPPQNGDLVCTWHHRNRITQAEHLFGEEEADVAPAEPGTKYGIVIFGVTGGVVTDATAMNKYALPFVYQGGVVSGVGTTSNTMTITRADLIAAGYVTGPMRLQFYTGRALPAPGGSVDPFWIAERFVECEFDYIVDAPVIDTDTSGGFNFDFSNNFDGG